MDASPKPAATPDAQLAPVDISAYARGNTGVDYVTTFDSGRAGPHVMVNALVHGNEICGAHALAFLFEHGVRPRRGKLTLSFANVAAYEAFDAADVGASRYLDEDFNRVWVPQRLDGPERSAELERARALRPIVEKADVLLDLHSMTLAGPALLLCGLTERAWALAAALAYPAYAVADAGHAAGTRLRDYGAFAAPGGRHTAMLVECGRHLAPESAEVAVETTLRFLAHFGQIEPGDVARPAGAERVAPQRFVRVSHAVAIESEGFAFARRFRSFEVIERAGTAIADDGGRPVRTPYDDCVLVMPSHRLDRGQTAVRFGHFVAAP